MDYADSFKMYLTTKMPNPHYLPEVCIKVNIINFTVTMEGLEDQLLGQVSASALIPISSSSRWFFSVPLSSSWVPKRL